VIRDRAEELHTFHARHFAEQVGEHPVSTNGHLSELTDEEVEQLARGARNSAKFEALKSADISGYVSHSEADQAYVSLLAFYTQDEEQLDRLYRRSELCRQKWLNRPDYRHRTITHALSNLRETYTPDDGAKMVVGGNGNLVSRRPNLYRDAGHQARGGAAGGSRASRSSSLPLSRPRAGCLRDPAARRRWCGKESSDSGARRGRGR
jgi:hypothetical protein